MLNSLQLYYFSPTGGTRKAAEVFCKELSGNITRVNLGISEEYAASSCDLAVIALPVFGGRIPAVAAERLRNVNGAGVKAVTMVVYGNRAYEDALLELNDVVEKCGFQVIASAAVVAQHSVIPEVGKGRPDQEDIASMAEFACKVLEKVEKEQYTTVAVPGNTPYKNSMSMQVTPISVSECNLCGKCIAVCPTNAIRLDQGVLVTDNNTCILCMACAASCPRSARILPSALQEKMTQMLSPYVCVRKENEYFL